MEIPVKHVEHCELRAAVTVVCSTSVHVYSNWAEHLRYKTCKRVMCCHDCSVFNICACVCVYVQPVPVQAGSSASDTRFVRQDKVYR